MALLGWSRRRERLGLILNPCEQSRDPLHPLYDIGSSLSTTPPPIYFSDSAAHYRVVNLGEIEKDLERFELGVASAGWREVYLAYHRQPAETSVLPNPVEAWHVLQLTQFSFSPPFRFCNDHSHGDMAIHNLHLDSAGSALSMGRLRSPWTGAEPLELALSGSYQKTTYPGFGGPPRPVQFGFHQVSPFHGRSDVTSQKYYFACTFSFGRCTNPELGFSPSHLGPHWIKLTILNISLEPVPTRKMPFEQHSCRLHHVDIPKEEPVTKRYIANLSVELARCPFSPKDTIVVSLYNASQIESYRCG